MNPIRLVARNMQGNLFQSIAVILCAAFVAAVTLGSVLIAQGAKSSLRRSLDRLGADVMVLPWGTITNDLRGPRFVTMPLKDWMAESTIGKIAAVPGVEAVSPQLFLADLSAAEEIGGDELRLVAIDPSSDFTLTPWLVVPAAQSLQEGEMIAGERALQRLRASSDQTYDVFGVPVRLDQTLLPTGEILDESIFVNFETAQAIAAACASHLQPEVEIAPGSISAVMVHVGLEQDPHEVSLRVLEEVSGVVPLESPNLFRSERSQMIGLLRSLNLLLILTWGFSFGCLGLVFSISIQARRQEIGVLRALGATRTFVLRMFLAEGSALGLLGGGVGLLLGAGLVFGLKDQMAWLAGISLDLPGLSSVMMVALLGMALALACVELAALLPAWQMSQQEAALTMRE